MHLSKTPNEHERASFTVAEFASRHRTSRGTVYQEIAAGRLRSFTMGRCRRISAQSERDWIALLEQEAAG